MRRGLVVSLRARGIDVETALDSAMSERSDEEHLDYATARGRVHYSCNIADFCRLHAQWLSEGKSHHGLVLGQQHYSIGEQLRRLLKLVSARSPEEMMNQMEFLSSWPR